MIKKNKSEISIVNLSSYTSPKISESKNKEWVGYGDDNNYFQYLIDRYNGSPTNNAIINGMSQMIYGKGLDATDSNKKPDEYAQAITLFHKDCVRKLAYDLKLMGQCAIQVIYSKDRSKIAKAEHFPVETLRAEKCNEDGDVEAYYYAPDWTKLKPNEKPQRIPAFGFSKEAIEILYIKPYRAGFYYYSPVDYQGGLQYAELEEEIANYHLNNILNGLAPSMLINFNNGTPNEEERRLIESKIREKFSGSSNAGKFILAFNDDPAQAATIEPIQLSDAHNQYQFLSDESMRKVMVSHRVVSPMLLGIKDNTGLGNNADELKTASILFDNTVIRPFQELLLDAFDKVLAVNNISLNLYFKTLQPLEFNDLSNVAVDQETREEETGVKMSLSDEVNSVLQELLDLGEDPEGELVDERWVDYDLEDELDLEIEKLNKGEMLTKHYSFVSSGSANRDKKSEQDTTINNVQYKVRYRYDRGFEPDGDSRSFCKVMTRANKLYRKEDIIAMGKKAVNPGFGPNGASTYSIWEFKGGPWCSHRWRRETYKYEGEGTASINSHEQISTAQGEREGYRVRNPKNVSIMPRDMDDNGYLPGKKRGRKPRR